MTYQSVDQLQNVLAASVFHYARDAKKAAGRALGTLVEVITFYLLKSWGFEHSVTIERSLAEYGNPEITHNVEYSLHPILRECGYLDTLPTKPITATKILRALGDSGFCVADFDKSNNILLTSDGILRNSCIVASSQTSHLVATLEPNGIRVQKQFFKPYSILECKRVGVEEGMRKGPQTIEKAKQGAYVARSVSSLQKLRTASGELHGIIYKSDQCMYSKTYSELVAEIIASNNADFLRDFILTVGVVSNHGNWFTSDNHNKELRVLAQSYDWLLFLTDEGLCEFITHLLLHPTSLLEPARAAFLASYSRERRKNRFTKVQMDYETDQVLQAYFRDNRSSIQQWLNVISPGDASIGLLQSQLSQLRDKAWRRVHSL